MKNELSQRLILSINRQNKLANILCQFLQSKNQPSKTLKLNNKMNRFQKIKIFSGTKVLHLFFIVFLFKFPTKLHKNFYEMLIFIEILAIKKVCIKVNNNIQPKYQQSTFLCSASLNTKKRLFYRFFSQLKEYGIKQLLD